MTLSKSKAVSRRQRPKTEKRRRKNARVPIDELLTYWKHLSKRQTLTPDDFRIFVRMTEETMQYFFEHYGWYRNRHIEMHPDKFFRGPHSLIAWQRKILEEVMKSPHLTDREYSTMKGYAKKFIPRIERHFGQQLARSHVEKTPFQDAEVLISSSAKLTYRWAAGIIASNHIAEILIRLSKFKDGEKFKDDIDTLYSNLKNRTADPKLKRFLTRSYRRFEDADKTRNRCAHVNEGEPTRQEIEQSISLGRLLRRFV